MKQEKPEAPTQPAMIPRTYPLEMVMLKAEPEAIELDVRKTAVIVIDMQNAYVSKGGMLDLQGIDVSNAPKIIEPIDRINSVVREKGCKVIWIVTAHPLDMSHTGGPNTAIWYKDTARNLVIQHPDWRDKLTYRKTWGADIVEGLKVEKGDTIFEKMRHSGFFQTNLDTILKTYNIKYLLFTGTATNMCVEATIRDAYYLGYFPILVSDATASSGPPFMQDAAIFNITACLGWVTTSENIIKAIH